MKMLLTLYLKTKAFFWIKDNGEISPQPDMGNGGEGEEIELNSSTSKEQLEAILALNQLCNVAKYLNKDWLPDFNNTNEKKYYFYINKNKLQTSWGWGDWWGDGGSVFFKSEKLIIKALEILGKETIKRALTLNH